MHHNSVKYLKALIFLPITVIYGLIVSIRSSFYRFGFLNRTRFNVPIIVVGNLTVGGTGKTPHVEFIANKLLGKEKLAFLSRGYGRKTKGFLQLDNQSTSQKVGDEPLQIFNKFKRSVNSFVGEDRVSAIRAITQVCPDTSLFLLDDAFQHLKLEASTYVLLTDYKRLFYNDFLMPSGLLRESRAGAKRADLVIVSKCPQDLSVFKREEIRDKIRSYTSAPVWFSSMEQDDFVDKEGCLLTEDEVVLLSGIAQNELFVEQVSASKSIIKKYLFTDHHSFSFNEVKTIVSYCSQYKLPLLTTEKDFQRLSVPEFAELISKIRIFVAPIKVKILHDEDHFWEKINDEINKTF